MWENTGAKDKLTARSHTQRGGSNFGGGYSATPAYGNVQYASGGGGGGGGGWNGGGGGGGGLYNQYS